MDIQDRLRSALASAATDLTPQQSRAGLDNGDKPSFANLIAGQATKHLQPTVTVDPPVFAPTKTGDDKIGKTQLPISEPPIAGAKAQTVTVPVQRTVLLGGLLIVEHGRPAEGARRAAATYDLVTRQSAIWDNGYMPSWKSE